MYNYYNLLSLSLSLQNIDSLVELLDLNLASNFIPTLSGTSLSSFCKLQKLNLSGNPLKSLEVLYMYSNNYKCIYVHVHICTRTSITCIFFLTRSPSLLSPSPLSPSLSLSLLGTIKSLSVDFTSVSLTLWPALSSLLSLPSLQLFHSYIVPHALAQVVGQ